MQAAVLGMMLSVLGVDYGYETLPDGGVGYIIQIHPDDLPQFQREGVIESWVPPDVKNIRRYRIEIGTKPLPRTLARESLRPADPYPTAPIGENARLRLPPAWRVPLDEKAQGSATYETALTLRNEPKDQALSLSRGDGEVGPPTGWLTIALTLVLLGSVAANVFFGWVTLETRAQYRRLLHGNSKEDWDEVRDYLEQSGEVWDQKAE